MNKKLCNQLIEQATMFGAPQIGIKDVLNEYGLIELVVRECASVATRAENNENELRLMYQVILEHFEFVDKHGRAI